jgi:hypothetical protein
MNINRKTWEKPDSEALNTAIRNICNCEDCPGDHLVIESGTGDYLVNCAFPGVITFYKIMKRDVDNAK